MKLVSLDKLKILLEKEDETHDDILNMIIEYNSQRIEGYLNRKLKYNTYTEYFSGDSRRFFLSAIPIEKDSVKVYYEGLLLSEGTDYQVWFDSGLIEFISDLPKNAIKSIKVEYKGGYKEDDYGVLEVPDDLKYACLLQSSWEFRNRDTSGFFSINLPNGSISTRPVDLLPTVKQILKQYRLPPTYQPR